MRHLFHTRAEVLRLTGALTNGVPIMSWDKVTTVIDATLGVPGELMCRLDLSFLRPGKDQPMPAVAGRAADRIGVMFFSATDLLQAGDRVHTLVGPVQGTFEIRNNPDPAADFSSAHHFEVQVIEVAQRVQNGFPVVVAP